MLFVNRAALSHSPVITLLQLLRELQARLPGLASWLVSSAEAHDQAKPQLTGHSITVNDAPAVVELDLNVVPNPSESVAITPLGPGTELDDLVRLHLHVNADPCIRYPVSVTSSLLAPNVHTNELVRLDIMVPSGILSISLPPLSSSM